MPPDEAVSADADGVAPNVPPAPTIRFAMAAD